MDFLLSHRRGFSYACAWRRHAIEEPRPLVDLDYCKYVRLGAARGRAPGLAYKLSILMELIPGLYQ